MSDSLTDAATPRGNNDMIKRNFVRNRLKQALLASAFGLGLGAVAQPALAQDTSEQMMVVDARKLVDQFVEAGVLTREQADKMIANALTPAPGATQLATSSPTPPQGGVAADGSQVVPYVPQVLRDQITEQVRTQVMAQAKAEGWAAPGQVADWTRGITLSGDIRVRGEGALMGDGNWNLSYPNFAAINAGGGYDISKANPDNAPHLNTTRDRTSARIRARLGLTARIDDWITGELRLATGNDRGPVSTNQTLGANGEFGKYAVWLDRANIRLTPTDGVGLVFGRFGNPFWTSELLFDEDLNFDGVAASLRYPASDGLSVFANLGAFPIFNTDFNFGSNEAGAFASKDRYLLAGQLGAEFRPSEDVSLKLAAGYFRFEKVQGEVSTPCYWYQDVCDTDATRPAFLQGGNTLFPIRDIIVDPIDPVGSPEVQYFGLASKFQVLNVHGRIDYTGFGNVGVRLEGDFVKNLGFKRSLVGARAANNLGPGTMIPNPNDDPNNPDDDEIYNPGPWAGGNTGWQAMVTVGMPDMTKRGDWQVFGGYRRVGSDAVLDALTDSDFHLGGTNAKGWILGGGYTFGRNTSINARWLSSDQVTGIPYGVDVIQVDLVTRF